MSTLEYTFGNLEIERTPSLPSAAVTSSTIVCSRSSCANVIPCTKAKTVKLVRDNTPIDVVVCSACFVHYLQKKAASLSVSSQAASLTTQRPPTANHEKIQQDITKSRRGNQSLVTPVPKKAGGSRQLRTNSPRQPRTSSTSCPQGPRHVASVTPLIPEGWAPGPAGEVTPYELPPLVISLPKDLTADDAEKFAQKHYEAVRDQLRREIRAGGRDALKVLVNARLQTLAHGKARPNNILRESIDNVPVRISRENFCNLLLNAFLPHWVKLYQNYPLSIANMESVRLMKGKNGIHLDNKEFAILEHCVNSNSNKLLAKELDVMFFIDSDHLDCAEAHRKKLKMCPPSSNLKADAGVTGPSDTISIPIRSFTPTSVITEVCGASLNVTKFKTKSQPTRPRARPAYGKKRGLEEIQETNDTMAVTPKRACLSQPSSQRPSSLSATRLTNLKRALSAQHANKHTAINSLLHITSLPVMFWLCPTSPLDILILGNNSDSSQDTTQDTTSCPTDWMLDVTPNNGYISFNVTQKLKSGAFKSMREGKINLVGLVGPCPFPTIASAPGPLVALKQPYMDNPGTMDTDSSSAIPTLSLSPDDQARELSADALSTQWADSLLRDVYDFISEYQKQANTTCPVKIPSFRFVTTGLAMATLPSNKKEIFLVEELIRCEEEGPWRKYINNNSSRPYQFPDHDNENRHRADFLAFAQHVQYWRTGCLAFTSDFQGT